jgi:hypothetical protein
MPAESQAKHQPDRRDHGRDHHDNRKVADVRGRDHNRDHRDYRKVADVRGRDRGRGGDRHRDHDRDHGRYSYERRDYGGHDHWGRGYRDSHRHGYGYPYYGPSFGISYYSAPSYTYTSRAYDYDDDTAVDVQRALKRRGYYRGDVDGDIGPGTRSAIRAYQYDRGLPATGRIDGPLLRSLGV